MLQYINVRQQRTHMVSIFRFQEVLTQAEEVVGLFFLLHMRDYLPLNC